MPESTYIVKWVPPTPLGKLDGPTITNLTTGEAKTGPKPSGPICDVCSRPWPLQPVGTLIASVEDCYVTQTNVETGQYADSSPPWAVCPTCCMELQLSGAMTKVDQHDFHGLMRRYIGINPRFRLAFRVGPVKAEPS